jgi:hypothetical protein
MRAELLGKVRQGIPAEPLGDVRMIHQRQRPAPGANLVEQGLPLRAPGQLEGLAEEGFFPVVVGFVVSGRPTIQCRDTTMAM